MSAEDWSRALGQRQSGQFRLRFERLGLEAACRSLSSGEVEECLRMGGERGLRYALYLSCDELRQAGESLKKQGAVAGAFDITEKLSYGDVLAAGAAILSQSGVEEGRVLLEGGEDPGESGGRLAQSMLSGGGQVGEVTLPRRTAGLPAADSGAVLWEERQEPWELADRLMAAWGNR